MAAYEPAESDFDEVSDYAYTVDSDASLDTLQDMMRRFTLDCRPDYTLKIRHRYAAGRAIGPDRSMAPTVCTAPPAGWARWY
jgi:hypothetical protein